jgi:hypothetical protein
MVGSVSTGDVYVHVQPKLKSRMAGKAQSHERHEIIRETFATGNHGSVGVRMAQFDAQNRAVLD